MEKALLRASNHIPLDSNELLWEWHPQSDAFFLSQGALKALHLEKAPDTLTCFDAHIPPTYRVELDKLRSGALRGDTGSRAESTYLFNSSYIRECLLVMDRDAKGMATLVMGNFEILTASPPCIDSMAAVEDYHQPDSGIWICRFDKRYLLLDARCRSFLNLEPQENRIAFATWLDRVHPEDWRQAYASNRLVFENSHMGDHFEYLMRVRRSSDVYIPLLIQGTIMARDDRGRALVGAGSAQEAEKPDTGIAQREKEHIHLLTAITAAGDGLWDWDTVNNTVYYSPRYAEMAGYKPDEFPPTLEAWATRVHPDDYESTVQKQLDIIASPANGDTFESAYRFLWADGVYRWILGRGHVTLRDENGRATRIMGMHTDITKLQRDREKLEGMIRNDTLTLVRSRDYGTMELERLDKNGIRPVSIIYADINGLKIINDHLGHHVGDRLLAMAGSLLRSALRASECIARMGGDEFLVILPYCEAPKAKEIAEHIQEVFATYNKTPDTMPELLALGVAGSSTPDRSGFEVVREADADMLRRKLKQRALSHGKIRKWLERQAGTVVSLEDPRYYQG